MKQLPHVFSQRDDRWASQRLGTVDGTTIGGEGCYISSFAMLACYYGHDTTPAALDDAFTNNNWYVSGNLLTDDGLQKAYADCIYQQSFDYTNVPADLGNLRDLLADPAVMVVLEIDFNPEQAGLQTHFVVAVDCDGTKVTIADPWYGQINDIVLHYADPATAIQKFVVYKGVAPLQTVAVDSAKFGELVSKATKYDAIHAAGYSDVDAVLAKIRDLSTQLQNALGSAQSAKDQAASIAGELQKVHQDDSTLATQLLDAQHAVTTMQAQLQALYKALNATSQDEALASVQTLQSAHSEVVKNVVPVMHQMYQNLPKGKKITTWQHVKAIFGF